MSGLWGEARCGSAKLPDDPSDDQLDVTSERLHAGVNLVEVQPDQLAPVAVAGQATFGDHLPDGSVGDPEILGGVLDADVAAAWRGGFVRSCNFNFPRECRNFRRILRAQPDELI